MNKKDILQYIEFIKIHNNEIMQSIKNTEKQLSILCTFVLNLISSTLENEGEK